MATSETTGTMRASRLDDIKSLGGLICAAGVLVTLIVFGQLYKDGCIRSGEKDFERCWSEGLAIAGMGNGGPLSAGVIIGYIIGAINKEKEKQEKYREGYWTFNPELSRDDNDQKPPQLH